MPNVSKSKARCAVNELDLLLSSAVESKAQQRHLSFPPLLYLYINIIEHNLHLFKQRLKNVWTSRKLKRCPRDTLRERKLQSSFMLNCTKCPALQLHSKLFHPQEGITYKGDPQISETLWFSSDLSIHTLQYIQYSDWITAWFFGGKVNFGSRKVMIGSPLIRQLYYKLKNICWL